MSEEVDHSRRRLLTAATVGTGVIGVAFAAMPFLASWKPSARAKALGAPVEVDASKLDAGQMLKVVWRGQPVFVVRRVKALVDQLADHNALLEDPASDDSLQPPGLSHVPRDWNIYYGQANAPVARRRTWKIRLRDGSWNCL